MKFIAVKQKLKQEIKELQEKINGANKVIYRQMQEIQELNNLCEYRNKAHRKELDRKDAVIEYLEGKYE